MAYIHPSISICVCHLLFVIVNVLFILCVHLFFIFIHMRTHITMLLFVSRSHTTYSCLALASATFLLLTYVSTGQIYKFELFSHRLRFVSFFHSNPDKHIPSESTMGYVPKVFTLWSWNMFIKSRMKSRLKNSKWLFMKN